MMPTFMAGVPPSLDQLQALMDEIERLSSITGAAPVHVDDLAGGFAISADVEDVWWIKIGAGNGAGAYAWTRMVPTTPAGTWMNYPGSPTGTTTVDPAYELNLNTLVPLNTIVKAWRGRNDTTLHFAMGSCA